jgi:predicted regulator of Ras-like GTPase activity (Roadblock/LC7/MglB family)
MVLSGFLFALAAWKLYQLELLKKEMREKEALENEVIDGLLELKKHSAAGEVSTRASDSYDLLSVALMHDVSNITIISDEGLPIVSTLKDAEEISAQFSALYDFALKILPDKLNKLSVKLDDEYVLIYSAAAKNDISCYVIIESKYELDSVTEKRLAREIMYVLDNYLSESTDDEEEYDGGTYIVAKEIANIDANNNDNNEEESKEDKKEDNNEEESDVSIVK